VGRPWAHLICKKEYLYGAGTAILKGNDSASDARNKYRPVCEPFFAGYMTEIANRITRGSTHRRTLIHMFHTKNKCAILMPLRFGLRARLTRMTTP
jgi:hypothetical protein